MSLGGAVWLSYEILKLNLPITQLNLLMPCLKESFTLDQRNVQREKLLSRSRIDRQHQRDELGGITKSRLCVKTRWNWSHALPWHSPGPLHLCENLENHDVRCKASWPTARSFIWRSNSSAFQFTFQQFSVMPVTASNRKPHVDVLIWHFHLIDQFSPAIPYNIRCPIFPLSL